MCINNITWTIFVKLVPKWHSDLLTRCILQKAICGPTGKEQWNVNNLLKINCAIFCLVCDLIQLCENGQLRFCIWRKLTSDKEPHRNISENLVVEIRVRASYVFALCIFTQSGTGAETGKGTGTRTMGDNRSWHMFWFRTRTGVMWKLPHSFIQPIPSWSLSLSRIWPVWIRARV